MTFRKGESGNPKGRPLGAKSHRTKLRELFDANEEKIVKKAIALALKGDIVALKLCLDRLVPPLRPSDRGVDLGDLGATLKDRGERVLAAMAEGRVSPDQAATVMQAIASQARIVEVDELERRVAALEGVYGGKSAGATGQAGTADA